MAANEVRITLTVDGDTVKIQEATRDVERLGEAGKSAHDGARESADNYAAALVKKLGIYAALTAAVYKLGSGVVSAFRDGIMAVDDFNKTVISVASTMADMAADKTNIGAVYAQNLGYAKDMFRELELAAGRHFASGTDLQIAWNVLTQKGVTLRREDVDNLGVIVDKVKLLTQGQMASVQIATELRALMDGQARANSQLAMLLKDQLGPGWDDLVDKHRRAGDFLEWMAGLFPGLIAAQKDIENTLESQTETLGTHLKYVGREGLTGAYNDIVETMKDISKYLEEHGHEVAVTITEAWLAVKDIVGGVLLVVEKIYNIVSVPVKWVIDVQMNYMGSNAAMAADVGFGLTGGASEIGEGIAAQKLTTPQETKSQQARMAARGIEANTAAWWASIQGILDDAVVKNISMDIEKAGRGGGGGEGGGGGGGKGGGKSSINKELAWLKKEAQEATKDANEILRLYDKTHANTRKLLGQQAKISERWEISSKDVLGGRPRDWKRLEQVYKPKDEGKDFAKEAGNALVGFGKDTAKTFLAAIKEGDFTELGTKIAENFLDRAIDWGIDVVAQLITGALGMAAPMVAAASAAGVILEAAAAVVAATIEAGAAAAAATLAAAKAFLIFHGGGLVMHSGGWVRAHQGLPGVLPGEVPAILQRDEFVLTGSDVRRLGGPGRVDAMRRGEAGRGGQPVNVNIYPRHQMTRGEWERAVRLYVAPALAEAQRFRGGR